MVTLFANEVNKNISNKFVGVKKAVWGQVPRISSLLRAFLVPEFRLVEDTFSVLLSDVVRQQLNVTGDAIMMQHVDIPLLLDK